MQHAGTTAVSNELDKWQPLDKFTENHPQFSISQLRWYLRDREHNGFNLVARKIGRRLYIHEDRFNDWVEQYAAR